MGKKIQTANSTIKLKIYFPSEKSRTGVIFIPGVSGGALSERWDDFSNKIVESGFGLLRYESWKNGEELFKKTIRIVHEELDSLVEELKGHGFDDIVIVGKSFGGGLALTYRNPSIKHMVLWAPAIGVSDSSNVNESLDTRLGNFKLMTDIKVDEGFLKDLNVRVDIIHGTSDDVIQLNNSRELVKILKNAELTIIDGADHSFKTKEHNEKLIKKTIELMKRQNNN